MLDKKGGRAHSLSYILSEAQVEVSSFFFKEAVIVRIFFLLSVFSRGQINMEELWVLSKTSLSVIKRGQGTRC